MPAPQPCSKPAFRAPYRLSPTELADMKTHNEYLLAKGLIQPSTSPYGAPLLFTPKSDGSLRMCIDYRALNMQTIKNKYPIPQIDDLLDQLREPRYFPNWICNSDTGTYEWRTIPSTKLPCELGTGRTRHMTWEPKHQEAMEQLKKTLTSAPVLILPDPERDYVIEADASDEAVGAVLMQDHGNGQQPIAYLSKKLYGAELNYPIHDEEALAIIIAFKIWRCYLEGRNTTVHTDHCSLKYLKTQPNLSRRQVQWIDFLETHFHYDIVYKPDHKSKADALSRPAHVAAIQIEGMNPLLKGLFTHGIKMGDIAHISAAILTNTSGVRGITKAVRLLTQEKYLPPEFIFLRRPHTVHPQERQRVPNVHLLQSTEQGDYQVTLPYPSRQRTDRPTSQSSLHLENRFMRGVVLSHREQHLNDLEAVFSLLQENRLITKGSKSKFLKHELDFLGHVISIDGLKIDPKKIATFQDWKPPTNLRELQSFLGFINYVRRFIPNMAGVTSPLTDLLKKGTFYEWGGEQQAAFEKLKRFLTTPPVLRIADPHYPFELITDASDLAYNR
ncbi:hypothetical protein CLOM_g6702 [Closterium sp. NIES-68]|nr:hypothetical protein CLOM_g6702 [Closterium sp. NIES-68]GJP80653.1 hypothetical protein CLOP_g10854 [Closterium sp. NIES-67]